MWVREYLRDELIVNFAQELLPVTLVCDEDTPQVTCNLAAVLIALRAKPINVTANAPCKSSYEWQVMLTKRSIHLKNHPGQICFPGGRIEDNETPWEGVLRETHEEVGIAPSCVHLLGRMRSFDSVSNFRVIPYIGIIAPDSGIHIDGQEVEKVYELPFGFFMDTDNHHARQIEYKGKKRKLVDMPWPNQNDCSCHVWGMTAMIFHALYETYFSQTNKDEPAHAL